MTSCVRRGNLWNRCTSPAYNEIENPLGLSYAAKTEKQRLPITAQHTEESLSLAHLHALAGMAGLNINVKRTFDYGVDGSLYPVVKRGGRYVESGFPLDFQLKATINWEQDADDIVYDLKAENYNDIVSRTEAETTQILILLCLPKSQDQWHSTSTTQTTLRHCCYWHVPEGEPTENSSTKRIRVPVANLLTSTVLEALMREERRRREAQI